MHCPKTHVCQKEVQFSSSKTDKTFKQKLLLIFVSPAFRRRIRLGLLIALTIGLIASCLESFLKLPSWFPRIIYVGAIAARFSKKSLQRSTNSGEICVFEIYYCKPAGRINDVDRGDPKRLIQLESCATSQRKLPRLENRSFLAHFLTRVVGAFDCHGRSSSRRK